MTRKLMSLSLALLCLISVRAQKISSLSLAISNESIAIPFTRFAPVHPGLEIGAVIWKSQQEKYSHQVAMQLGGYTHRRLETGIYLKGEYAFKPQLTSKLSLELPLGIGYMHTFYPGELYAQDETTGEFSRLNSLGRPHFIASTGLGLSYQLHPKYSLFVRQDVLLETPFVNSFPIMIHSILKLGLTINLI